MGQETITAKEIAEYNNQIPTRIRNHKVWFWNDGSIGRIAPIGAGFGVVTQKGVYFSLDQMLTANDFR